MIEVATPALPAGGQLGGHRRPERVDLCLEERIDVRVVGVDEGRQDVARAIRMHLVQVEDDVGAPDVVDLGDHQPVLDQGA